MPRPSHRRRIGITSLQPRTMPICGLMWAGFRFIITERLIPYRTYLRDFGSAKRLTTAQTEMGNPTFDDLFSDLTLAGVSYWEVAYSANATLVPSAGLTGFTPSSTYFRLRQLMHYVRPGAVRIGSGFERSVASHPGFLAKRESDDGHGKHLSVGANGQFERIADRKLWPVESGGGHNFISGTWHPHGGGGRLADIDQCCGRIRGHHVVSVCWHKPATHD